VHAFRWNPEKRRMENLRQALLDAGVIVSNDLILKGATGVSADGAVIVGWAFNTVTKQYEAFRAVLPQPT
jgi:hypothetical protein